MKIETMLDIESLNTVNVDAGQALAHFGRARKTKINGHIGKAVVSRFHMANRVLWRKYNEGITQARTDGHVGTARARIGVWIQVAGYARRGQQVLPVQACAASIPPALEGDNTDGNQESESQVGRPHQARSCGGGQQLAMETLQYGENLRGWEGRAILFQPAASEIYKWKRNRVLRWHSYLPSEYKIFMCFRKNGRAASQDVRVTLIRLVWGHRPQG